MTEYIKLNPFRIYNISGSSSLDQISTAGRRHMHAARVGLTEDPSLGDWLPTVEEEEIMSLQQKIRSDPLYLLVCRILWPTDVKRWTARGTADKHSHNGTWPITVDKAINRTTIEEATTIETEASESPWSDTQLVMTSAWLGFVSNPTSAKLEVALASLQELIEDGDLRAFLLNQVSADLGQPSASDTMIEDAFECIAHDMIANSAQVALNKITARDEQGFQIASAIISSPLNDDWEDAGIQPIVDYGYEVAREIEEATHEMRSWSPSWQSPITEQVTTLKKLRKVLTSRHPASKSWKRVTTEWTDTVVISMVNYAMEIAKTRNDFTTARQVLQSADKMSASPQIKETLRELLSMLNDPAISARSSYGGYRGYQSSSSNDISPWGALRFIFWLGIIGYWIVSCASMS